jgi:transcription-repair coupling factor (superfamily II helicase)
LHPTWSGLRPGPRPTRAGDLFGEEKAGHLKLNRVGLYRHLLKGALAAVRGDPVA